MISERDTDQRYRRPASADVGFDPEFKEGKPDIACRLRMKNVNNLLHFDTAADIGTGKSPARVIG